MKNAEMEIVKFDAADVITTSGPVTAFWFKMSDFTDQLAWKADSYQFVYGEMDEESGEYEHYINPINALDGDCFTNVDVDAVYQLVCEQSINNGYDGYLANVVVNKVSSGEGTQILTWDSLIEWISQYDNK